MSQVTGCFFFLIVIIFVPPTDTARQHNSEKLKEEKNEITETINIVQHVVVVIWCLTPLSAVFQSYHGCQCTYLCFPGVLLTSAPHNILSKPLAAFPRYHCRNYGQR